VQNNLQLEVGKHLCENKLGSKAGLVRHNLPVNSFPFTMNDILIPLSCFKLFLIVPSGNPLGLREVYLLLT
jgi:hypothetical protein